MGPNILLNLALIHYCEHTFCLVLTAITGVVEDVDRTYQEIVRTSHWSVDFLGDLRRENIISIKFSL